MKANSNALPSHVEAWLTFAKGVPSGHVSSTWNGQDSETSQHSSLTQITGFPSRFTVPLRMLDNDLLGTRDMWLLVISNTVRLGYLLKSGTYWKRLCSKYNCRMCSSTPPNSGSELNLFFPNRSIFKPESLCSILLENVTNLLPLKLMLFNFGRWGNGTICLGLIQVRRTWTSFLNTPSCVVSIYLNLLTPIKRCFSNGKSDKVELSGKMARLFLDKSNVLKFTSPEKAPATIVSILLISRSSISSWVKSTKEFLWRTVILFFAKLRRVAWDGISVGTSVRFLLLKSMPLAYPRTVIKKCHFIFLKLKIESITGCYMVSDNVYFGRYYGILPAIVF